jgi:hypothetical protein
MSNYRLGAAALAATTLILVLAAAPRGRTADHLDAPDLSPPSGNLMGDIADLFVFPDDPRAREVAIIATFNPAAGIFGPVGFDPSVEYALNIDIDGDAGADTVFTFDFGAPRANGRQDYTLSRDGMVVASTATERVTRFDTSMSGRLFAGVRDDPFFFDLDAFLASGGRTFCDGGANDFFAGLNVNAIAIQVPAESLGGAAFGTWVTTHSAGGEPLDRMGFPALNTVFVPANRKDAYNRAIPANDEARFKRFLRRGFKAGGNTAATSRALADALLPDILPFDPAAPAGFLNGRQLADDVIDAELGLLTAGALAGDCVPTNDVPFNGTFPYLADAH